MENIQQVKEIIISSKGKFEKFLNDFKDSNFFGKLGVILNAKDEYKTYLGHANSYCGGLLVSLLLLFFLF